MKTIKFIWNDDNLTKPVIIKPSLKVDVPDAYNVSNKDIVYIAYLHGNKNIQSLLDAVGNRIKYETIRNWVKYRWPKDEGLPRITQYM